MVCWQAGQLAMRRVGADTGLVFVPIFTRFARMPSVAHSNTTDKALVVHTLTTQVAVRASLILISAGNVMCKASLCCLTRHSLLSPSVIVEPAVAIPPRAVVPRWSQPGRTPTGRPSPSSSWAALPSFYTPEIDDVSAEKPAITGVTSAVTLVIVSLGLIGSFFALKASSSASSRFPSELGGNIDGIDAVPTLAIPPKPSGHSESGPSPIDPVTLLLHFQTISTSGFLSLAYPNIYRYFTFNFSWANLIVVSEGFKKAANQLGLNEGCLEIYYGSSQASADSGLAFVAKRYGVDRKVLGGIVSLGAIVGVICALALFVLVAVVLHILSKIWKGSEKIQSLAQNWPSISSNLSLRLVRSRFSLIPCSVYNENFSLFGFWARYPLFHSTSFSCSAPVHL